MSIIETLTEGMVNRDMAKEGQALLDKWSATGLLKELTLLTASTLWLVFLKTKRRNFFVRRIPWKVEMLRGLPLLHSQSFVVYSPDLSLMIL